MRAPPPPADLDAETAAALLLQLMAEGVAISDDEDEAIQTVNQWIATQVLRGKDWRPKRKYVRALARAKRAHGVC